MPAVPEREPNPTRGRESNPTSGRESNPTRGRESNPTSEREPSRMSDSASPPVRALFARQRAFATLAAAWSGPRPDVVVASRGGAPGTAAWLVSVVRRAPLVLDLRERTSDRAAREPHVPRLARAALRVWVADPALTPVLVHAGVDAGRVRPVAAGEGADCESAALAEARRLARGRDVAHRPAGLYGLARRLADLLVGLALLVLLLPLLALVAVLIRLDSPGPALFRQRRIGRGSSEFTILKFRTMKTGTPDLASHLVGPGSSRVTRLGRMLRRTSIDELPQLWHLVTGEMSLVGPRPALHNQFDLIAMRQQADVDALRPGLTGWAQVHGRDDIPLAQKVGYDVYYAEHLSPWLDLTILARTPVILLSDRGVY